MRGRFLIFLLVFIASCSRHYVVTGYTYNVRNLAATLPSDEKINSIVKPYKDSLDVQMNVVLAVADDALTKTQPESDLGNFMCDMLLKKSSDYYGAPVDFTFLNHGGIRIPNLPKGNLTIGKIIELTPFENRIVVMKVKGSTIDSLFNYMAQKGGWHVGGARYKIKNNAAVEITIGNAPLDKNKTYIVSVSDYLANGGDNCNMLKGIPYTDTRIVLREAIMQGLKELTARGGHVKSVLDGRIQRID